MLAFHHPSLRATISLAWSKRIQCPMAASPHASSSHLHSPPGLFSNFVSRFFSSFFVLILFRRENGWQGLTPCCVFVMLLTVPAVAPPHPHILLLMFLDTLHYLFAPCLMSATELILVWESSRSSSSSLHQTRVVLPPVREQSTRVVLQCPQVGSLFTVYICADVFSIRKDENVWWELRAFWLWRGKHQYQYQ